MLWWKALLLLATCPLGQGQDSSPVCSVSPAEMAERDPALREMSYDVGDGEESTLVYVMPDVTSFYQGEAPASKRTTPKHNGFSAKFINGSNRRLTLYWVDTSGNKHVMREHPPFTASGTASFPTHHFEFTTPGNPDDVVHTFIVGNYPDNIQMYDPYTVEGDPVQTKKNLKHLTKNEREKYDGWRRTMLFHDQYKAFTGRSYLANYLRKAPSHYMWRADYFGQEHWVTSDQTQFLLEPPEELLVPIDASKNRIQTEPVLRDYRESGVLNMTLKVLSCAPRAFEIPNFLSETELQHVLTLAGGIDLKLSSTGDIGSGGAIVEDNRRTRTSFNSWVTRETSPIVDAIYRRAADLLRIDESLMRYRNPSEHSELSTRKSIAESLQLVHYSHKQEYTAHHDFGFSKIEDQYQGARFATLLLYLNEGMEGGETSFPRWVNAETFKSLDVVPEQGKAVLFYSQLPDGNLDDFSHHAALPIISGEKWLMNLWVWDPIYE